VTVAPALWSEPEPLAGLAGDYNLLRHGYRSRAAGCELVLTDTAGVDAVHRACVDHARAATWRFLRARGSS
jgi:hypothetical protein